MSQADPRAITAGAAPGEHAEAPPQLPIGSKSFVACKKCHLVLAFQQFVSEGCSRCGEKFEVREDVIAATTPNFSGFVGLVDSNSSWVARLIGCAGAPSGVYAAHVDEDEDEEEEEEEGEERAEGDDLEGPAEDLTE